MRINSSEGGMIRLENLIELKLWIRVVRAFFSYWHSTNTSLSSNSSRQYLNQQYPPPLNSITLATSPSRSFECGQAAIPNYILVFFTQTKLAITQIILIVIIIIILLLLLLLIIILMMIILIILIIIFMLLILIRLILISNMTYLGFLTR